MKCGDVIGDYVIEGPISVGKTGQADVYRARRRHGAGTTVAIKILAGHLKSDERSVVNFEEEAELLTKLNHRNIVRIEAFDTSPPTPFIAQEYIDGQSIAELLKQREQSLPLADILDVALQTTDALSYAHDLEHFRIRTTAKGGKSAEKFRGIIHRDLSTDNILVTDSGEVKLIDFGIARAADVATVTTTTGVGKDFYIAPEVELGSNKAFASTVDIYSFGICLYEMLMTWRPESRRIRVLKQFHRNLHHLYSAFPDDVPEEIKRIIVSCVRREPKDRPQTMEAVRDSLLRVQEELSTVESVQPGLPEGIAVRSELLSFDHLVELAPQYADDLSMRIALSGDETRILVLCDRQTKIHSFNLSGGEKQTHHVPHGARLSALVGLEKGLALGMLAGRAGLLLLDETGEWHPVADNIDADEPVTIPDSITRVGESLYIGDSATNRIIRIKVDDGMPVAATTEGHIVHLGPFGTGGNRLYCIDPLAKWLSRADLQLEEVERVAICTHLGWPTSLAADRDLLFIVDSQERRVSILTSAGGTVSFDALTWKGGLALSQVLVSQRTSMLIALETSVPSILFFEINDVDSEMLQLASLIQSLGIGISGLSFEAMEGALCSYIDASGDKARSALRIIDRLKHISQSSRKASELQVRVHTHLLNVIPPERHLSSLRDAAQAVEELGNVEIAKRLYLEYLQDPSVEGYDPDIRDRYGRLLEAEHKWEEIKDFEGGFLSKSVFHQPRLRVAYERSYQRLGRAYTELGIPVPARFRLPPTANVAKARALLQSRQYEEALSAFAEMVQNQDYRQMTSADAVFVLAGYVECIKRRLRVLSLEDWQQIHRALFILVSDYSDEETFDPAYYRDLRAAEMQIRKLGDATPRV